MNLAEADRKGKKEKAITFSDSNVIAYSFGYSVFKSLAPVM